MSYTILSYHYIQGVVPPPCYILYQVVNIHKELSLLSTLSYIIMKESQRQIQDLLDDTCGTEMSKVKIQLQQSKAAKQVTEQLCTSLQVSLHLLLIIIVTCSVYGSCGTMFHFMGVVAPRFTE